MNAPKLLALLFVISMLTSSLFILNGSRAGVAPPPDDLIDGIQYIDGDWTVTGYENYSNEIICLTGNLVVAGTGMLAFENVTLMMNCTTSQGQYQVMVCDGGSLFVNDTDDNPATTLDRSLLTNGMAPGFGFLLQVNRTAAFSMRDSEISKCGLLSTQVGADESGPRILTSDALFENCLFHDNANGLVCDSGGLSVRNCTIGSVMYYGIRVMNATYPSVPMHIDVSNTTIQNLQHTGIFAEAEMLDISVDNCTIQNNKNGGILLTGNKCINATLSDNLIRNNINDGGIGIWGTPNNLVIRADFARNNLSGNRGISPIRLGFRSSEAPVRSVFLNASGNDVWDAGNSDGLVLVLATEYLDANLTGNNFVSPSTQNGVHLGLLSKEINVHPATKYLNVDVRDNEISNLLSGALRICGTKSIVCNITGNHIYHPQGLMSCGSVTVGWFKAGTDDATPENATVIAKDNLIEGIADTGGFGFKAIYNLNTTIENNTIHNVWGPGIRLGWLDDSEYNDAPELWALPTRNVRANVSNNNIGDGRGPGIWLYSSAGSSIFGNNISNRIGAVTSAKTAGDGIRIQACSGNTFVTDNTLKETVGCGIRLFQSEGISVHDNNFVDNQYGIGLDSFSKHNLLFNNMISKQDSQYGYYLMTSSLNNTIPANNTVNGEWLRYYHNQYGTSGANIVIQGHDVQEPLMSNLGQLILANSSYVTLQNNIVAHGVNGIFLYNVDNSSVVGNHCVDNTVTSNSNGLHIESSSIDNIVKANILENNSNGISLDSDSIRNNLWDNSINKSNVQFGLSISADGTVWNNEIPLNNTVSGTPVRYYHGTDGLDLSGVSVNMPLMTNVGQFTVIESSDLKLSDINLSGGVQGLYLVSVSNATLQDMNMAGNFQNIYCRYSNSVLLRDSVLGNGTVDVDLDHAENITTENVTMMRSATSVHLLSSEARICNSTVMNTTRTSFNVTACSLLELLNSTFLNATVTGNSTMNVNWYLDLGVRCNDLPVENANVTLRNISGAQVFHNFTGADGYFPPMSLREYTMTPNATIFQSPYHLLVERDSLGNYNQSISMDRNREVIAVLGDLTTPELVQGPEIAPGSLVTSMDRAWLNATIVDSGICPGVISQPEWFLSASMPAIVNGTGYPLVPADGVLDSNNESVTGEIDLTHYSKGQRTFWVHGRDSAGNWCDWEPVTVNILDDEGPAITSPVSYSPTAITTKNDRIWLALTLDDSGLGDSKVSNIVCKAVKTAGGESECPVLSVTAQDGLLNGVNESLTAELDVSGLDHGQYIFVIQGVDEFSNSGAGRNVTIEIMDGDAPAQPQGLIAANTGNKGQVELNWIPNSENDLAGYRVYRTMWSGSNYELVGTVNATNVTWSDDGLEDGRTYYYVITAFDNAPTPNVSPYSAEVNVTVAGAASGIGIIWWLAVPMIVIIIAALLFFARKRNAARPPESEKTA